MPGKTPSSLFIRWILCAAALGALLAGCNAASAATPAAYTAVAAATPPVVDQPVIPPARLGPVFFEALTVDDGLSDGMVWAVLQDRMGFLWIGSEDGLNRYDGYTFTVFQHDPNDPGSISQSSVTALAEDTDGNLWVGTRNGGLNRYNRDTGIFTRFEYDPEDPGSLSSNQVSALCIDRQGILWVGTADGGLNRFWNDAETFRRYQNDPDDPTTLNSNQIHALYADRQGALWVGTPKGLDRLEQPIGQFTHYQQDLQRDDSLSHNVVQAIFEDSSGRLWVGTQNGLNRMDAQQQRFTRYLSEPGNPDSLSHNRISALYEDRAGVLWVGTTGGGLNRFDRSSASFTAFKHQTYDPSSLADNRITAIYEDRSGILWVGVFGSGIDKMAQGYHPFTNYRHNPEDAKSLSSNMVLSVLQDSNGDLWVGTDGGGLNRLSAQGGNTALFKNSSNNLHTLSSDSIRALAMDEANVLWVGAAAGLNSLAPGASLVERHASGKGEAGELLFPSVSALALDPDGSLWVGSEQEGLSRFDRSTRTFVANYFFDPSRPGSLSSNEVLALRIDSAGELWVGTSAGLDRLDRSTGEFIHYRADPETPYTLSNNRVLSIFEDSRGDLWVGAAGGLNRLNRETGQFAVYRRGDGLVNETINAILEDEAGNLWLSTNYGLARFEPNTEVFKNYDARDGLQGHEFNRGAALRASDGMLYFGGMNGLTAFHPDRIQGNPYVPPLAFTSISLRGIELGEQVNAETIRGITLAWPNNHFEFEFTALSFARPEQNQFAYRLENFDDEWVYTGTRHNGRYTNLPGGVYTLRLRGANEDGVWNLQGAALQVTILAPFWDTWWFRGGAVLALALALTVGFRLRTKMIETRNRDLERQVRRRTKEIEQRNQELEALYRAGEMMQRYLTVEQTLHALVDSAVRLMQAYKSAVFTWEQSGKRLVMRVSRGFSPSQQNQFVFARAENPVGAAASANHALILSAGSAGWFSQREDVLQTLDEEGIRSALYIPLLAGEEVFGVFGVFSTLPDAFDEEALRLYLTLAQRGGLSLENARLFEQTKELAVIEERNRLARDLHDSAKQKAFAALAQLGAAQGTLKNDASPVRVHLGEAENLVYEVIEELTFLIQEMYPLALQEKGLVTALREYIYEWENRTGMVVSFNVDGGRSLPLQSEQALYRMAQEALSNVTRHSRASQVQVSLRYDSSQVTLTIADNGCGFDAARKNLGLGLRSMHERAASLQGRLQIESAPGQGTRLQVTAPLDSSGLPQPPTVSLE